MHHPGLIATVAILLLVSACGPTEPTSPPDVAALARVTPSLTTGFTWRKATPESQGMCGSVRQLGCARTLQQIWNSISNPRHNTKRFVVIRNDRTIFDRGGTLNYPAYSASKGLLGAPTLVHAMSSCGVSLTDPAARWLSHGEGARWDADYPWTDITVEHLANHTSGICDYGNKSAVCRNESAGWQAAFERTKSGGPKHVYPGDAFSIARAKSEQNREPALAPGSTVEYSNVGHALLNYVVQRACGQKLTEIFDLHIKQPGMGSPVGVALISTDEGQQFNQSTGVARWRGPDGAAVLRLAGRLGIWDNRNVEPVRHWDAVTRIVSDVAAAAAAGWGVVYENNSRNMWTKNAGHRRLSQEMFGHGGNYSTVYLNDPLTSTIIVRQGENNATGASYLTKNGCAPGWTGTAPACTPGTNWTNNWNVASGTQGSSSVGARMKLVDPLQEAFFFPPPFCRMTSVVGQEVDRVTDVYDNPAGAPTVELAAEITVNPREGAGSSVASRVEFYRETGGSPPQYIGDGVMVAGSSPARYELSYLADNHGAVDEVRTYFASCVASSVQDGAKEVVSYSRPVRVRRL
jgi:CubicO group peptidase (beta-lactamase class C family)